MFIWVSILSWKANSVYITLDNNSSFVLENPFTSSEFIHCLAGGLQTPEKIQTSDGS